MNPFAAMSGVVGIIFKELCSSILPKIKSICLFRSNLESLKKEIDILNDLGNRFKGHADAAERSGRASAPAVTRWLQEFEEIKNQVDLVLARVEERNNENRRRCLPTCLRCRMGVKVAKNLHEVRRLIQSSNFLSNIMLDNYLVKDVQYIPGPSITGQSTALKNFMSILKLLHNDSIRTIGIWGMGGVGKTTLIKNLNNKLETQDSQRFGIIIWATVSKDFNLKKLQIQVLERLNLEVKAGEDETNTASRLHERLKQEERFLLILDDVWDFIDLDYLGVPQPELHKGYKVILTSRSLDICRLMKTDSTIKVDVLTEEESWKLFIENAGDCVNLQHILPIARELNRECSGLPLAIKTVGASMRGKTTYSLWHVALAALRRSVPPIQGIEEKVYRPLKWSYDSLSFQGMNAKSCFLYCALYPEDFSIEVRELVQCWFAEGIIKLKKYEDSINCGNALIENLKDSCLLEDGRLKGTVRMHDVVRDVALWISSSSNDACESFVESGIGLEQISDIALPKSLKRVSFIDNKITRLPDDGIHCPHVLSLLLQGNFPLEIVPKGFLQGFPALKVLNLSTTCIHTLPHSLSRLHNLEALLLRSCLNLRELSSIGGLHRLQVLDCSQTDIESLPNDIGRLANLRLLDLSETRRLIHIPNGSISRLSSLEILDMTNSLYRWGLSAAKGQGGIRELRCLTKLCVLYIHLDISFLVSKDLAWLQRLKRFSFFIGPIDEKFLMRFSIREEYEQKKVAFYNVPLTAVGIEHLLRKASYLALERCWHLECLYRGFCYTGLKSVSITQGGLGKTTTLLAPVPGGFSSRTHTTVPTQRESAKFDLLPNLEELILNSMSNLVSVSELILFWGLRLLKLKTVKVSECPKLKNLFSSGCIPTLENIEEVTVSSCEEFVELFENESSSRSNVPTCIAPKLGSITLNNLPKFTNLSGHLSWRLEYLEVIKCSIRKLPFTAQNAVRIKELRGELQWWNELEWDHKDTEQSLWQYFKPVDVDAL